MILRVRKRRYYCKQCRKPFTEPIPGVMPRSRSTQRFKVAVGKACENFCDLSRVRKEYRVSNSFIHKAYYGYLEKKLKEYQYPWPRVIGVDEHFFTRRKGYTEFATMFTDMTNKRLRHVVLGKDRASIKKQIEHIPGRENVKWVTLDLSETYKGFIFDHFPNAQMVADKFHVLRLLTPHLIKRRKLISTDRMSYRSKKLLTMSSMNLDYFDRKAIWKFLENYPELKELYSWKERLFSFYRIKGYKRAKIAMEYMLKDMGQSNLKEIKTLFKTLSKWKEEILNYFITRLTNARTEGFNNIAKLVQRRAFGYKNFENYKRRLLSACAF